MANRNIEYFLRLQPGDLIEISHTLYSHWAIYIKNDDVIHLIPDGAISSGSFELTGCSVTAVIKKECLKDVVKEDSYFFNNSMDSKWKPLPIRQIKKLANAMVGRRVYYSVTEANCEHFVHLLRYGKKTSDQVVRAHCAGIAVKIIPSLFSLHLLPVTIAAIIIPKVYHAVRRQDLKTMEDEYKNVQPYLSLKRGYLIRIFQPGYKHWAMYVGGGEVIYLCQAPPGYVIRRERLAKVAPSDQWEIDNCWDNRMEPLPKDQIIKNANAMIQRKIKRNGKDFVKLIRYFETPNSDPKPGDMITILRPRFNQWAIYVGDGDIIYLDSGRVVVRNPLVEVAASDLWCVNNKLDSSMKPLCAEEIIRNAKAKLGQEIKSSEEEFIRHIRCVKRAASSSAIKKKVNNATNGTNAIGFAVFKVAIYTIVTALGILMFLSAVDILDVSLLPFI